MLREETLPVAQDSAETAGLIVDLIETMQNAEGIGLAANQVGKGLSMAVIDVSHFEGYEQMAPFPIINPVIIGSEGESVYEEGCLSLPGIREEIVRPDKIGLRFYNAKYQEVELEAHGILSRVLQHEIDHLHGKYFIDYLSAFKFSFLRGKLTRMMKGDVEADYLLAPPSAAQKPKGKSAPRIPGM